MAMKRVSAAVAALGMGAALFACGSPSIKPSTGGDAGGGSFVTPPPGEPGKDAGAPEMAGVAPSCTNVDPAKMPPGPLVSVPAGTFTMGCNAALDTECRDDEKPPHSVTLPAYSIDKTEVTQAQYFACVKEGKCNYPKCVWDPCAQPDNPIACVKNAQAATYCAWASKRLPTEAEWEMAARGTDGRKFPWGNMPASCDITNMMGCGNVVSPVGTRADVSPFGAFDMGGNVVEWTADWYDQAFYAMSPAASPTGPAAGAEHVGRGGGFLSEEIWHRASARDFYESTYTRVSMGFRCAK